MLFELEATDPKERDAFFAAHPDLRVTAPSILSSAARVAVLAWSEHCVECSPPACYTSCDLYHERIDGKCRRFTFGMHPNRELASWLPSAAEIDFKLISHMWTEGNASTVPVWAFRALDAVHRSAAGAVRLANRALSMVAPGGRLLRGFYDVRKRAVRLLQRLANERADGFLLQVINPHAVPLQLRIEIVPTSRGPNQQYFQSAVPLPPGFSEHWIARDDIAATVDLGDPFRISMQLGNVEPKMLYILCATFVAGLKGPRGAGPAIADTVKSRRIRPLPIATDAPRASAPAGKSAKSIKAVIWDLDNTLWQGTLVESGNTPPALRPGAADLVRALDERGILQSIVSKNDYEHAWKHVEAVGLAEYFLYPRISWAPKSQGVREIVDALNIGRDTVAFVDDQPFERAEVSAAVPEILVLPETAMASLLADARFKGSMSEEARNRRAYYRNELARSSVKAQHGDDYVSFLRECDIRLDVHTPRDEERDRVQELTQRTNQMNFSGTRYSRDDLDALLARPGIDAWVMRVTDRFGDYGLVGFCATRREGGEVRMIDLAMSCRVQAKHVEHAFLRALMRHYRDSGAGAFVAEYRRTERNTPAARVFDDLGFTRLEDTAEGREQYRQDLRDAVETLDYITVELEGLLRVGLS